MLDIQTHIYIRYRIGVITEGGGKGREEGRGRGGAAGRGGEGGEGRGGEGRGGEGRDDGYTYCNRYVH